MSLFYRIVLPILFLVSGFFVGAETRVEVDCFYSEVTRVEVAEAVDRVRRNMDSSDRKDFDHRIKRLEHFVNWCALMVYEPDLYSLSRSFLVYLEGRSFSEITEALEKIDALESFFEAVGAPDAHERRDLAFAENYDKVIMSLRIDEQTNKWKSLEHGLDLLRTRESANLAASLGAEMFSGMVSGVDDGKKRYLKGFLLCPNVFSVFFTIKNHEDFEGLSMAFHPIPESFELCISDEEVEAVFNFLLGVKEAIASEQVYSSSVFLRLWELNSKN